MSLTTSEATATSRKTTGPVVLLTGAAQGIGRATAGALASRGYRLALMDRAEGPLASIADELGSQGVKVASRVADVCDATAVKEAVSALEAEVGPTDVLVACAGVGKLSTALDLDLEGFRQMLDVNVLGVARTIEAVLTVMFARKRGHIVGIASVAGFRGLPWMPGYSASKAALATYLEGLRPPLKRRGVTITTVYPGFVRTGLTVETPFRHPQKMLEPAEAAEYLVRVIARRPRDATFPPSAAFQMGLLRRLPSRLFDRMMDYAGPRALNAEF
jgi:short-subunit dehydrogenase